MRKVRPTPTAHHVRSKAFILKDLFTASHVFIRVDATRKSLDQPYEGHYRIMERLTDKVFKVNVNGEPMTVSTHRLKPAYLENTPSDQTTILPPVLKTYAAATKTQKGVNSRPKHPAVLEGGNVATKPTTGVGAAPKL